MSVETWQRFRLADVVTDVFAGAWGDAPTDSRASNVQVLRATNIDSDGRIDYRSPAHRVFTARDISRKSLRAGDLLLEASGGGPGTPVGRVALHVGADSEIVFACSNFFRVMRPDRNVILPGYLTCVLERLYRSPEIWRYQQQTTGLVNLKFRDYLNQLLLVPPLGEQQRIVELVNALSAAKRGIEASITKLRSVRQGLITEQFSRAYAESGSPTSRMRTLDSLADVAGGLTLGGVSSGGTLLEVPYLRVANVQDGFVSTLEMKSVRVTPGDMHRFRLRRDDVLVTEGGDFDKVGRGAVWDGRIDPCLNQNHVFRVRCDKELLDPHFLNLYMSSVAGRRYFLRVVKQTTNLASINSSQLKAMPIPCPPLEGQRRTVELVGSCDEQIAQEVGELAKLRELKVGLVDDLLSGRVAVAVVAEE